MDITKITPFPFASSLTGLQVLDLELPPSPTVTEVATPEPGIYHGICEYFLLGQCQVEVGPSGARGSHDHLGWGLLG